MVWLRREGNCGTKLFVFRVQRVRYMVAIVDERLSIGLGGPVSAMAQFLVHWMSRNGCGSNYGLCWAPLRHPEGVIRPHVIRGDVWEKVA